MLNPQIVKSQHYVPESYLRRFTNDDGFLERLVLPTATVLRTPKSPSAECQDAFFYGQQTGVQDQLSQEIESFWKNIEDFTMPELDAVVGRIEGYKQLTDFDISILAHLGAMLWMRTPHFRETLNHNAGKLEKQMYQMRAANPGYTDHILQFAKDTGRDMSRKEAEDLRQFILNGRYNVSFNNTAHLQFMVTTFEGFRNLFFGAKWRFYLAGGDRRFVTSTAPCIEPFPEERRFFWGPSFYERQHLLPLSSRVKAEAINPFQPGKRVKRQRLNDNEVSFHNLQQANWSHIPDEPKYSRCYATRKDELEELVRFRDQSKGRILIRAVARKVSKGF